MNRVLTYLIGFGLVIGYGQCPTAVAANAGLMSSVDRSLTVLDQDRRVWKFRQELIRNKPVAINFIFTQCSVSCPLSSLTFRKVQEQSRNRDLRLISISVDPVTDTPERLKAYAAKFHAEDDWRFLTGKPEAITSLLKALGVNSGRKESHTNVVIVGNAANDHWLTLYGIPSDKDILAALSDVR